VVLRHSVRVNGVDSIAVTKLDVLDELPEIKVCTAYELKGKQITEVPLDMADLAHVKPVYTTVKGWQSDTTSTTEFDALPKNAQSYLNYIANDLGVSICLVSTGPKRTETIMVSA